MNELYAVIYLRNIYIKLNILIIYNEVVQLKL